MTEDFNKNDEIIEEKQKNELTEKIENDDRFFVNNEEIKGDKDGAIAVERNNRLYVILGWISAALTVFISPLFAIAGITFGILLNRQAKGSGNVLIITNIVLALINIIFSAIILMMAGNMLYGY